MKHLVICGGGSSAHTLIPFLRDSIFEVSILTSKPEKWSNDITLEYGGSISFSTTLPDDTYIPTWYLNGTMLGRGGKIEIFWDEEALNLNDREEALMLVLEKDGNIYSKTITFVC